MSTRTPQSTNRICLALILAISCLAGFSTKAQNWTGGGADQNWSTGANWSGGTAPGAGTAVTFPDGAFPVTTNAQGVVNNIVQSSMTIAALTYNNNSSNTVFHFDTTQIPSGNTLMVNGNLTVGGSTPCTVTMTGGGTL